MWPTQLSTYPHFHHNEMRYISPFGHYACSGMESKWFMLWLQGCPQWLLEMAREALELQTSPPPLPALRRCLRLWLNLLPLPQASRHITLGFYYFPAPQHTESHVKVPASLLGWQCPSCPCIQASYCHSSLTSCPITLSHSLCLFCSSFLVLTPAPL